MADSAQRYLDLIGQHLQDHHAALFVGSGLSRNAHKVNPDAPDSPLWNDLANIFMEKLNLPPEAVKDLEGANPLALAEHIEIAYGRPELDRLLLSSIRDMDYQPAPLHYKLLQLPWSDIFTTNYDTLLERASEELTEHAFSVITSKDDLVGSSGTTRIIKLHGSFPSHRPFIITSEDYRTYPHKYAPFVNTVQQSLLENTLCMIGFSGNDPNFESWIGWIRDNLGAENAPYMYLLLHRPPSDTRKEWLRRRNIIPVDLSEIFKEKIISQIYEKAFEYLFSQYRNFNETRYKWELNAPVSNSLPHPLLVKDALPILRRNHETYPGNLTLEGNQIDYLRKIVITPASQVLSTHCAQEDPDTDDEMEYLYEYDWLRGKALLPLFYSDLRCYQQVLNRHAGNHTAHKLSIQLSVLRTLRECGGWKEWSELHDEILSESAYLTQDQIHQLHWEECLCSLSQFQFQELRAHLENWIVSADTTVWSLRKAGLWAEYGECKHAQVILQQAILNLRRRLAQQSKPDPALLSLESAMMNLQSFITQALKDSTASVKGKDGEQKSNAFIDAQHRVLHAQYHVSWDELNAYFVPRMESSWEPYHSHQVKSTFDFGRTSTKIVYQEDKDRILAFSFLRFREETGIPFRIRSVYSNAKAACGAAERIALFTPYWSILTLVRADEPKAVGNVITRGVLSSWSPEEVDERCQFYLDAIVRTEAELTPADWFYRNSFARLSADVLPEVLSELCSKCSASMLDKLLNLLERIYTSPKRLCYQQTGSLTKRLLAAYPVSAYSELLPKLARFPLNEQSSNPMSRYFPEPLRFIPLSSEHSRQDAQIPLPEIQALLTKPLHDGNQQSILERLLYCFYHGILTKQQKRTLRDLLWNGDEFQVPNGWACTVCMDLPVPADKNIPQYLSKRITETARTCSDISFYTYNDETILRELASFAFTNAQEFSPEQLSTILVSFFQWINSLSHSLSEKDDFMGNRNLTASRMYDIAGALWILTACRTEWRPTETDRQVMSNILSICGQGNIFHHGLRSIWNNLLGRPFPAEKELGRCLRSVDEQCSYYGYDVLATAIRHLNQPLLSNSEIQAGITVMAQQIAWCIPKQLTSAVQTSVAVVKYQPQLLSSDTIEFLMTGLSQLLGETEITSDDTIELASEKGSVRRAAVALAKELHRSSFGGERSEILESWIKVTQNNNEFAEVRNV